MVTLQVLLNGFPGQIPRGWLGWSTVTLIKQSQHFILFDTGAHNDRPSLLEGLAQTGVSPAQIETIILSHLHFDHVANIELFPNADIFLHQTTATYSQTQAGSDLALSSCLTNAILTSPRLHIIEGEPELWPNIRVIQTPGHTGGCISLVIVIGNKTWVLAADAIKHRAELAAGVAQVAFDRGASQESIGHIRSLADWIVPGHDVPLQIKNDTFVPAGPATFEINSALPDGKKRQLNL